MLTQYLKSLLEHEQKADERLSALLEQRCALDEEIGLTRAECLDVKCKIEKFKNGCEDLEKAIALAAKGLQLINEANGVATQDFSIKERFWDLIKEAIFCDPQPVPNAVVPEGEFPAPLIDNSSQSNIGLSTDTVTPATPSDIAADEIETRLAEDIVVVDKGMELATQESEVSVLENCPSKVEDDQAQSPAGSQPLSRRVRTRASHLLGFRDRVLSKADIKRMLVNYNMVSFMEAVNLERSGADFYIALDKCLDKIEQKQKAGNVV
jgi:hypothetical protein